MATRQKLERKIAGTEDMSSIVSTMKNLAAVNARLFGQARDSLKQYTGTIERALQVLLNASKSDVRTLSGPITDGPAALIVFGAVRGMCAQFTDHIAEHVAGVFSDYGTEPTVVAVGPRVTPKLQDYGVPVSDQIEMYGSIEELPAVVRACILKTDQLKRNGIRRIVMCYNRESKSNYEPHHETLVPVDPDWLSGLQKSGWPTSQIPTVLSPVHEALPHVLREHLFSRLYRAATESLATENETRLSAMQSAEDNLDERLDELRARYNRQRQQDITSELLDIVGGYTALEN